MNAYKTLSILPIILLWGCKTTNTGIKSTFKHDPSAPPPGHSSHGEAFNKGPRQAAYLMGTTGHINFPITTKSNEAQAYFNQGIGQLHGFWYLEAERSFRQVLKLHPNHPMAYWGIAMANAKNRSRAQSIMKEASAKRDILSERERLWIDVTNAYLKESDTKKRKAAHIKALQNLADKYPDDLEAQAFLTLAMYNNVKAKKNYDDIEKRIAKILEKIQTTRAIITAFTCGTTRMLNAPCLQLAFAANPLKE